MTFLSSKSIFGSAGRRRTLIVGLIGLFSLVAAACGVQESNAYPIELFSEMHYSQATRAQEPPRLQPPAQSVAFDAAGGPGASIDVPEFRRRPYVPVVGQQLFQINCSVCHGLNGQGNGSAAAHLTSNESFWFQTNGTAYSAPANLLATRSDRTPETWFTIVNNGINVMPAFEKQLSEEDIWDIITYLFDEQTGLGTAR